jgi:membrane protein implicated in regulation of membrane protease activity
MIEFARGLHWWHWWIAAAVLAVLETFMPGAVAIWFAASALAVGALLLVIPLPWQLQLVVFGVLGFTAMLAWRRYRPQATAESAQPTLNQRGVHYIGQCYVVVEPLRNGTGKVRIGDGVWLARGADQPEGARVRVTGIDGAVLIVEPA